MGSLGFLPTVTVYHIRYFEEVDFAASQISISPRGLCRLQILCIIISTSRDVHRRANVTGISRAGAREGEVAWNGPIYGRAWIADDAGAGLFVFDQPARNQAENGDLGIGVADRLCVSRVLLDFWTDAVLSRGQWREQVAGVRFRGFGIRVWGAWQAALLDRIHLRVSGFAHNYFHRLAIRVAVLHGRHAGGDSRG